MTERTLMERETAGLHVEIRWAPLMDAIILQTWTQNAHAAVTIKPERAHDAFDHPTVYLNDAQVAQLFPKTTSER